MPLCSVFLLYYHITFSQRKKEVKGNKKSVKNTVGKTIELSTDVLPFFYQPNEMPNSKPHKNV